MQTGRLQVNQQMTCFGWLPLLRIHECRLSEKSFVFFDICTFLGMVLYSGHFAIPRQRKFVYRLLISWSRRLYSLEWSDIFDQKQSNYFDWNVFFDLLCSVIPLKIRVKRIHGRVNVDALYLVNHWPTFFCFESPTALCPSQHNFFRTMWEDHAKGLLVILVKSLLPLTQFRPCDDSFWG